MRAEVGGWSGQVGVRAYVRAWCESVIRGRGSAGRSMSVCECGGVCGLSWQGVKLWELNDAHCDPPARARLMEGQRGRRLGHLKGPAASREGRLGPSSTDNIPVMGQGTEMSANEQCVVVEARKARIGSC